MLKLLNNRILASLYTLAILLTLNWFLPIFDSLLAETSFRSRIEIMAYLTVAVALELIACHLVAKYYNWWGAKNARTFLIALILAVNLVGLLLSFYEPFLVQKKIIKAGEVLILWALFYVLFKALAKNQRITSAFSLLYVGMISVQVFGLMNAEEVKHQSSAPGQIKSIQFEKTPNIYLMSFDALIPAEIASEYLGIEKLDYISLLEEKGARFFNNTFSDEDATKKALNMILFLDPAIWEGNVDANSMAFSGLSPSPVFEIFRNNGYKIDTSYGGNYLLRGKYIDHFTTRKISQSYCTFSLPWFYFQHLGYCTFKTRVLNPLISPSRKKRDKAAVYDDQIIDNFIARSKTDQPWLSFIYTFAPGHTPKNYSHEGDNLIKYKKKFIRKQKQTTQYMRKILEQISLNDPTGIVLVFGDHGAWLSRGLQLKSETAEFVIRDRHMVLSAIYPGDACASYLGSADGRNFVTPTILVRQIITCLSNGVDPIDGEADYSGPYEKFKFQNFTYE